MKTLFTTSSGWVSFRSEEGGGLKSQVILQRQRNQLYCFVLRKYVWYRMNMKLVM